MEFSYRNHMAKFTDEDYYDSIKDTKNWVHRASAHLNYLLAKKSTLPQGWDRVNLIHAINSTHFHNEEHADEYRDGGRFAYVTPKRKQTYPSHKRIETGGGNYLIQVNDNNRVLIIGEGLVTVWESEDRYF